MIIEDPQISWSRVFVIVGFIIFLSSLIYISVLTSKLISLKKIIYTNNAKERMHILPTVTPIIIR